MRRWVEPRTAALGVLLGALAVLPYLNALDAGFTFDDRGFIVNNPLMRAPSVAGLFDARYNPLGHYRPLTMLSFVVNWRLDPAPGGFHAVNVGLHALVTLAVFAFARGIVGSLPGAFVAAAAFAVHPIHTEAVTSIVGRAELLAALAVLATLLAFGRARDAADAAGRRRWTAVSVAAFALGLLAKESAVTAIALVALVDGRGRRPQPRDLGRLAPYVIVGLAFLALRAWLAGSVGMAAPPSPIDNPLAHVGAGARLRTALIVVWEYLALLTFPVRLSADYSFDQVPVAASALDPRFLAAAAVLGTLAALLVAARRRAPVLGFAALFAVASLALAANVLFPIGTVKAERLLYLPSIGWCLAAGWLLATWSRTRAGGAAVVALVLVGVFAGRTWVRNADWRDDTALFEAAVRAAPRSCKAHRNLAALYRNQGRTADAIAHYQAALAIRPDYADAALQLGETYDAAGAADDALRWYAVARRADARLVRAWAWSGNLYARRGEYGAAEAEFRAGLARDPRDPHLLAGLALARLAQGDAGEAGSLIARAEDAAGADGPAADMVARARATVARVAGR